MERIPIETEGIEREAQKIDHNEIFAVNLMR